MENFPLILKHFKPCNNYALVFIPRHSLCTSDVRKYIPIEGRLAL